MSLILARADIGHIVGIYQSLCEALLFPGCNPTHREQVMRVLNGIRNSNGNIEVDCKFATDPDLRQMQILITTRAVEGPKVAQ